MEQKRYLVYPGVALAASGTLLFELTQTRILSYVFWNHIVYLTVSLALLGFGISGTLVAIFSTRRDLFTPRTMARLWMGFGLSMFGAVALTAWVLPLLSSAPVLLKLGFCYVVYVIPFMFSGAILSVTFSRTSQAIGRLYATDLLSAGLACALFFLLLPALGAAQLVCVLGALSLVIGYLWTETEDETSASLCRMGAVVLLAVLALQYLQPRFLDFTAEDNKEMGAMMNHDRHPATRIERTTWTPLCRVDVVGNDHAMLLHYPEHPLGSYKIIAQDGTAHTRLLSKKALDQIEQEVQDRADCQNFNLVYQIKPRPEVVVIGVGGGLDVAYARAYGATSILGIELNPAIYRYASLEYAGYTGGLLDDPRLTLLNQEGRSVLRSTDRKFDVIQINAIDKFAALSSGAYVLSENYLYTVEAFEDMFACLKENGVLSIQRWLFVPPRETLRLTALACEAWKRQGVADGDQRIMVIGRGDWAVSLFKQQPFTPAEVMQIRTHADRIGSSVYYWPKVFGPDRQSLVEGEYYKDASPRVVEGSQAFNDCVAAYREGREREFFRTYLYNVTPTTDDSPFFFEYHHLNGLGLPKWDSFRESLRGENHTGLTLYLILAQSTIFVLLAVFWPLWKYQRAGVRFAGALRWSGYFAAIGLGFMMVEIAVIQKCVLFLGNPMYALSAVLASLLVSAGLGSTVLPVTGWRVRQVTRVVGPVFLVLLAGLILGLNPLFYALLHLPLAARVLIVAAVTFPLGFLMGMFFPAGLQAIRDRAPGFVPWAWGINGCASVYGSIVAILLAMVYGFNVSLWVGAALYVIAFIAGQFEVTELPPVPAAPPAEDGEERKALSAPEPVVSEFVPQPTEII